MWKAWSFVIGLLLGGWLWVTGNPSQDLLGIVILLIAVPLFWAAGELIFAVLHAITH